MSRADDIRKRMAKRKRERERMTKNVNDRFLVVEEEEKYGFEKFPSYETDPGEGGHPLFNKEFFLFKILASACLVLIVAIIFRNGGESLQPVKNFVTKSMEHDFQFAAVADWYENKFGKPLALLPFNQNEDEQETEDSQEYALPAAARILEEFAEDGQKVSIETEKGAAVTAMSEGRVSYVGDEEGFGKTVIIQHADKSETWYGNLESVDVTLYEFVQKGNSVGTAANAGDGTKGMFYFAIKKGDDFIDPIQVIQFD
ncbi:peptidoglycan DD-metalloendopeptidase family protein [Robertmurraya massiliosenegalensis]|uniref:peptidoglycan DD-metalloendopeptidase family protein n=1 Tax=Robertmurraya massiliosenegalensis TaxID=1287657 RepID=UPI0003122403|nr:peptidoglycan DD-metalloendopeptidase family protein [Robertmurraya massiliosenegalensis]